MTTILALFTLERPTMKVVSLIFILFCIPLCAEYLRDANKQVVLDSTTKLMWQDNDTGDSMNWERAQESCSTLVLGGYNDWRLPSFEELKTLVADTKVSPVNSPVFKKALPCVYWSSSEHAKTKSNVWAIFFLDGTIYANPKTGNHFTRCVRNAQ